MVDIINISTSRRQAPTLKATAAQESLPRTLATQTGMIAPKAGLKNQETSLKLRSSGGLLSVKELWVNIYLPLEDPLLPPKGGIGSVNRGTELDLSLSKETRMQGGVGRGSSKLPFTRLGQVLDLLLVTCQ